MKTNFDITTDDTQMGAAFNRILEKVRSLSGAFEQAGQDIDASINNAVAKSIGKMGELIDTSQAEAAAIKDTVSQLREKSAALEEATAAGDSRSEEKEFGAAYLASLEEYRVSYQGLIEKQEEYKQSIELVSDLAIVASEKERQATDALVVAKQAVVDAGHARMQDDGTLQFVEGYEAEAEAIGKLEEQLRQATQDKEAFNELSALLQSSSEQEAAAVKELEQQLKDFGATEQELAQIAQSDTNVIVDAYANKITGAIETAVEKGKEYVEATGNWLTGNGQFQESLTNMKEALSSMLPPAFATAAKGAKTLTVQLAKMALTPLGAVITGIALALKAMHSWFTKSAKGQRTFAGLSAYIGSILSSLVDVLVEVGEYLYHCFADAEGPLHNYGEALVNTISSAVKTVMDWISALGNGLGGLWNIFSGNWEKGLGQLKAAGENAVSMWKNLGATVKNLFTAQVEGIKGVGQIFGKIGEEAAKGDVGKRLGNWFGDIAKKAADARDLAIAQVDLEKEMLLHKDQEAALDAQIAKNREKIDTLTGKEKDALIEETKILMKRKFDNAIKDAKQAYSIVKAQNALHTSSIEDLAKEYQLHTQIHQLQAQQLASTRFMTRMQESNRRSMARAAASAGKKAASDAKKDKQQQEKIKEAEAKREGVNYKAEEERIRTEEEIESQIADAKIKAMREGFARTMAERKREREKELEEIDKRHKAALEAERNRQEQVHEAEQAVIKARGGTPTPWKPEMFDETTEAVKEINRQFGELKNVTIQVHIQEDEEWVKSIGEKYQTALDKRLQDEGEYQEKIAAISKAITEANFANDLKKARELMRVRDNLVAAHNKKQGEALRKYFKDYGNLQQKISATTAEYEEKLADQVGGQSELAKLRKEAGDDEERFIQLAVQRGASEGAIRSIIKKQAYETQELEKKMNGVKSVIDAMGEDLEKKTRKQFKAMVRDAEAVAKAIPKSSSYKQFKTITGEAGIGITEEDFDKLKNDPEELKKFLEHLEELKKASKTFLGVRPIFGEGGSFSEINFKDEKGRKAFADMLNSIAAAADFASNSVKKLASAFGEDLGAGAEVATEAMNGALEGAQAGAAIGGPWGAAAGAALGLFSSLADSLAALHDAKHEKRIEQLADQIEVLQEQYDDLGDAVAEAFSKDASQLIAQQNKLLEQQKVLIQQQRREEEAKKKTDKDKLKDYDKQLKEIDKALEENKEKAIDAIFGEDVQSAIESFAESLTSAWENGTNSVKGARDQVKRMMRQMVQESIKAAIQSSNKIEEIRAKLQEYYADNFLSEYEQRAVMKMAEDYQRELNEQFGWSEKLFSEDYEAGNGTSGGFATMSQESADELNGRFTAMQVKMENQLAQQIIANTHLATMELSLTAQSRTLSEMRDMHVKSNEYLLSIVENTQDIVPKLNNLIQRIDVKL